MLDDFKKQYVRDCHSSTASFPFYKKERLTEYVECNSIMEVCQCVVCGDTVWGQTNSHAVNTLATQSESVWHWAIVPSLRKAFQIAH